MNTLQQFVGLLSHSLRAAGGLQVTYSYGGQDINLTAVKSETEFEVELHSGLVEQTKTTDWLIQADELVISGAKVLPERGNTITYGDDVYEVAQ